MTTTRLPVAVALLGTLGILLVSIILAAFAVEVPWGRMPELLTSESSLAALGVTLRTGAVALVLDLLLGIPMALVLARSWRGVGLARVLVLLPLAMPPVVAGVVLLAAFGRNGLLGPSLEVAGLDIAFQPAAVVLAQMLVSLPFLVLTLESALRLRDQGIERAAATLGASPLQVLLRVTLPLLRPALVRGTALAAARILGEFGATLTFAGSLQGTTRTLPLEIYLQREVDPDAALALGMALLLCAAVVVLPFSLSGGDGANASSRGSAATFGPGGRAGSAAVAAEPAGRTNQADPAAPTGGEGSDRGATTSPPDRGATASPPARAGSSGQQPGSAVELADATVRARGWSLSLKVPPGGRLAVMGPNGAGKSTLAAVLTGLLRLDDGEVQVAETVVSARGQHEPTHRRGIVLLAQAPALFPHLSALDNAAFAPRVSGVARSQARERAVRELIAVGAEHLAQRRVTELSGGQAARVALARALAADPAVLVLDEPFAALDVGARAELRSVLARVLDDRGTTCLLVTHDLLDALALARRTVLLENGRRQALVPTRLLTEHPPTEFAAELAGLNLLTGTASVREDGTVAVSFPGGRVVGLPAVPMNDRQPATAVFPLDAVALGHVDPHGSARTTLTGTVDSVMPRGPLTEVRLRLDGGSTVRALVTPGALSELSVAPGATLVATVKATQVTVQSAAGVPEDS